MWLGAQEGMGRTSESRVSTFSTVVLGGGVGDREGGVVPEKSVYVCGNVDRHVSGDQGCLDSGGGGVKGSGLGRLDGSRILSRGVRLSVRQIDRVCKRRWSRGSRG